MFLTRVVLALSFRIMRTSLREKFGEAPLGCTTRFKKREVMSIIRCSQKAAKSRLITCNVQGQDRSDDRPLLQLFVF